MEIIIIMSQIFCPQSFMISKAKKEFLVYTKNGEKVKNFKYNR